MEHTNEFLQGMFSAYMGCDVINTDDGKHLKMIGVSSSFISVYEPPYPFCESEGDEYEWMYSECKPILTPLSDITDKDAMEVAKICEHSHTIEAGKRIVSDIMYYSPINHLHIIDYLRSRHYDCGYMHIPSLITAGLAIKKKYKYERNT